MRLERPVPSVLRLDLGVSVGLAQLRAFHFNRTAYLLLGYPFGLCSLTNCSRANRAMGKGFDFCQSEQSPRSTTDSQPMDLSGSMHNPPREQEQQNEERQTARQGQTETHRETEKQRQTDRQRMHYAYTFRIFSSILLGFLFLFFLLSFFLFFFLFLHNR